MSLFDLNYSVLEASALVQKGYCLAVDEQNRPVFSGEIKDLPVKAHYHKLYVSYQDFQEKKHALYA